MMTTFDNYYKFDQLKSERENPQNTSATSHLRNMSIANISPDKYAFKWRKTVNLSHEKPRLMDNVYSWLGKAVDVTIQIGEEVFEAPLMILQCYSEFFQSKTPRKTIKLQESKINGEIFNKIAEWMQDSTKQIERNNMILMLKAARYLRIKHLETQILNIVQDAHVFQENEALMLYLEANLFDCKDIKSLMISRVQKFFLTFVSSEEFVQLSGVEVENWLKLDSIGLNTEIEVFYTACRWLLHDWEKRKNLLTQLMKCVRFGLAEPWRIVELRMLKKDQGKLSDILMNNDLQETLETSLSYSTYRCCFQDNSEKFNEFLNRFDYEKLKGRIVMDDPIFASNFRHTRYSYTDYEVYLKNLRLNACSSWKSNIIRKNNEICASVPTACDSDDEVIETFVRITNLQCNN